MQKKESKYAVCPFYHGEKCEKIYCDGVGKGASTILVFKKNADAAKHRREYCYSFEYKSCPLAKTLDGEY